MRDITSPLAALRGYSYELAEDGVTVMRYDHRWQAYTGEMVLDPAWTQAGVNELSPDLGWSAPRHG